MPVIGRILRLAGALCILALPAMADVNPAIATWRLDARDLGSMGLPDSVLAILKRQLGVEYADTQSLVAALNQDLANYPQQARVATSAVRINLDLASAPIDSEVDLYELLPPLKIWMDSISMAQMRQILFAKAGLHPIPGPLLAQLEGLVGVEFPTSGLLHAAARSRLALGLGSGRYASGLRREHGIWLPLDSAALDTVLAQLKDDFDAIKDSCNERQASACPDADVPTALMRDIEAMMGKEPKEGMRSPARKVNLEALIDRIYDYFLRRPVAMLSHKRRDANRPPRWTDIGCGCSRDTPDNEVYGFYVPPPEGPRPDSAPERIDFEVLRRIEYLGLTFDRNGNLLHAIPGDSSDAFLRKARNHGTRVDWVIAQSDPGFWNSIGPNERTALFEHLRSQIVTLLDRPSNSFWERAKAYVPFFGRGNFGWGDGVALQFSNYPTDKASIEAFDSLYRDLLKELATKGPIPFHLNLVIPAADLPAKGGIGGYDNIVRMLGILDSIHPKLPFEEKPSRILVLMDSPAEDSRRAIQRHIDEAYSSDIRRRLLHSFVPVLFPQTRSFSGLEDEIAYFNDTYFALGVWPLPMQPVASGPAMTAQDSLSEILWNSFAPDEPLSRQEGFVAFVCVHRWPLRLAFLASLFAAGVAGLLLAVFCRARQLVGRQLPLVVAGLVFAPLSMFSGVLFVDPDLAKVRDGNVPYLIVSGLFVLTIAGIGVYFRTRKSKPSREALRQAMARLQGEAQE